MGWGWFGMGKDGFGKGLGVNVCFKRPGATFGNFCHTHPCR